jgi:hypothetical protein
MAKSYGHFAGHEKEPKSRFGGKDRGRKPLVHSHSSSPKRSIKAKGTGKRPM